MNLYIPFLLPLVIRLKGAIGFFLFPPFDCPLFPPSSTLERIFFFDNEEQVYE